MVRVLLVLGAGLDLLLGIWLQFWLQSLPIVAWLQPTADGGTTLLNSVGLSAAGAAQNAMDKQFLGLTYFGDAARRLRAVVLAGIGLWSCAGLLVFGARALRGTRTRRF
jgi:hypothetical protein